MLRIGRACASPRKKARGNEKGTFGKAKSRHSRSAMLTSRVTYRVMMRQHDQVRPIAHFDIGSQKSAHVLSCAGESPVV